jgi:hypothetical protein
MCVLHITSKSISFADFLKKTTLPVYRSHEKGDVRRHLKLSLYDDFGFSCDVSDREWTDLTGQIEDAYNFLLEHENELRTLISTYVLDDIRLDFPYECRLGEWVAVQCDYLPPEFLRLVGDLGIGIELSHYPVLKDDDC